MMPGGRPNERQMQMMMRRMGMTTEPVEGVEEVLIRTKEKEIVLTDAEVTILTIQGVRTYQIVGSATTRARTHDAAAAPGTASSAPAAPAGPPEEDVTLVMEQANVERDEAVAALRAAGGEPAEAIMKILARRGPV
jgi:nascent polypeptide-associated complex subunit alpha